jgi:protein required for attachment to host cells
MKQGSLSEEIPAKHGTITWFLVADGRQAQVYTRAAVERRIPIGGRGRHVHEVHSVELVPLLLKPLMAESADVYQVGRNQTGMVFESGSNMRHMGEPHVDARKEVKQHFAQRVADFLGSAKTGAAFDRLVLVAPPSMLGEIEARLSTKIRRKLVATLPKELTHLDARQLVEHLAQVA